MFSINYFVSLNIKFSTIIPQYSGIIGWMAEQLVWKNSATAVYCRRPAQAAWTYPGVILENELGT